MRLAEVRSALALASRPFVSATEGLDTTVLTIIIIIIIIIIPIITISVKRLQL